MEVLSQIFYFIYFVLYNVFGVIWAIISFFGIITLELFMTPEQLGHARQHGYPSWAVLLAPISPIAIAFYCIVVFVVYLVRAANLTLQGRGFKPAYKPVRKRQTTAKTRATREKLIRARAR